jgi:hypothetical protein
MRVECCNVEQCAESVQSQFYVKRQVRGWKEYSVMF